MREDAEKTVEAVKVIMDTCKKDCCSDCPFDFLCDEFFVDVPKDWDIDLIKEVK